MPERSISEEPDFEKDFFSKYLKTVGRTFPVQGNSVDIFVDTCPSSRIGTQKDN